MNFDKLEICKIEISNVADFEPVINSIKYICEYSGYNPDEIDIADEIAKPELPENGKNENNYIYGFKENNIPLAWIQFYENFMDQEIVFLGELYIKKEFQNNGYGKMILLNFEKVWKMKGYKKIVLNVDLKNWAAIRFWTKNGFTKIENVIGKDDYSINTYAQLRLSKEI